MAKLEDEISIKEKQLVEKDAIIKNFDLLIDKFKTENESFKHEVEEKGRAIKNLEADLEQEKREKEFINSKLRFLEGTEASTPNVISEDFDNMFLKDLKNGGGFNESPNIGLSSIFQQRNSKYLPHLRDSYAIMALDKNLPEHEMKVRFY